jgi:hypothetical protein
MMTNVASIWAVVAMLMTAAETEVTFLSPTECSGEHGVYRWGVKTDHEAPPDAIPAANKLKPSDIAAWPEPTGKITTHTPRSGREKDWFEITEPDGDLHIQLVDADGSSPLNVVVEIPVKQFPGEDPWSELRTTAFSWSNAQFPFKTTSGEKLTLTKHPAIRVQGKAFFDATHKGTMPNRRKDEPGMEVTVWEIHPVMSLEVLQMP